MPSPKNIVLELMTQRKSEFKMNGKNVKKKDTALIRVQSRIVSLMLILWIIHVLGCNHDEESSAKYIDINGQIILDIVEPREVHKMLLVIPQKGTITPFDGYKTDSNETTLGTRAIQSCHEIPTSISPDHRFVAECRGDIIPTLIGSKPDEFILRQAESTAILYKKTLGQRISGFLWSPDSLAVAVLTQTVHISLNPKYWFYALSGHPVQYEIYYFHVIDVVTLKVASFKVPLESSFSRGELISWNMTAAKLER